MPNLVLHSGKRRSDDIPRSTSQPYRSKIPFSFLVLWEIKHLLSLGAALYNRLTASSLSDVQVQPSSLMDLSALSTMSRECLALSHPPVTLNSSNRPSLLVVLLTTRRRSTSDYALSFLSSHFSEFQLEPDAKHVKRMPIELHELELFIETLPNSLQYIGFTPRILHVHGYSARALTYLERA